MLSHYESHITYFKISRLLKIYTKTGDDGSTGLQGNYRIDKSHPRIISYGTVDEANAALGIVLTHSLDEDVKSTINSNSK